MKLTTRKLALITVAGCSFLLGRLISTALRVQQIDVQDSLAPYSVTRYHTNDNLLTQQIRDQHVFHSLIHQSQNPSDCSVARYLVRDEIPPKDGFASEFQYISRLLQSAVSTRRILFIAKEWKSAYCPESSDGWTCLWQPFTHCTRLPSGRKGKNSNRTIMDSVSNPLTFAILPRKHRSADTSPWFDPLPYSSRQVLPAPISFPLKHSSILMDVIPHWERAYGRYWIRSQITHYLWRPSDSLQEDIRQRLVLPSEPFIGMHIRLTDNIYDFAKSFGRNATWTRQLDRFRTIAERIRRDYNFHSRTVFIATDHARVIEWARRVFRGWTVHSQAQVQRATTQQRIWFARGRSTAGGAMATDLEILRRADYLIGSFQSNVFRLAAQLNTAWHVQNYSIHTPRHFPVDVEWFEDP